MMMMLTYDRGCVADDEFNKLKVIYDEGEVARVRREE